MNQRGKSPGLLPPNKSHPAHLDGHGPSSEHDFDVSISRDAPNGGIVFNLTKVLAAATADEALAVVGVPHANFGVSPSHRLDLTAIPGDNSSLGNSIFYDDPDSVDSSFVPDPVMTQKAIERTQAKIENIKEQIGLEQASRDENVNEFLKLCANADRQQQIRMKQLFEKKNQKSSQSIAQLQRKLEEYQKKLKNLEERGFQQKPTQKMRDKVQGLRNVGGNIRDTVMAKPKLIAHKLRHKFGSADNLTSIDADPVKEARSAGSSSLPRDNLGPRRSLASNKRQSSLEDPSSGKCLSEDGAAVVRRMSGDASEKSDVTSESMPPNATNTPALLTDSLGRSGNANTNTTEWKAVMQEINLHKEEVDRLREEIEESRQQFKHEVEQLLDQLREERERYERLEEQMNDLTELHQHEIENINSGVKDMEEKVFYQSEERLIDIKENLQSLETKLNSLEHQQAQQQYINIEGLDSSDAKVIFMKLLTAIITVIHVGLFFVGMLISFVKPFLRTKQRMAVTLIVAFVSGCMHQQQEHLASVFGHLSHLFNQSRDGNVNPDKS